MTFITRLLGNSINQILSRGKSILLLGPRQTGKTTLLNHQVVADLNYTFLEAAVRRDFELETDNLIKEVKAHKHLDHRDQPLTVLIDEVQKVPDIMDTVQYAIDHALAQFILTGSSIRKLRRHAGGVNLLPGRVIELKMDALSILEMSSALPTLDDLLIYGSLPEVILQKEEPAKEQFLISYVNTYLEEEIRAEALVRNVASFSRFLRYAAVGVGKPINVNKLSQELGISRHTIDAYYQILEDCLIADRIEPLSYITSRRRLTKAPKYLMFDLGVRRIAAGEGLRLPEKYYGDLFEQFVGLEILKILRIYAPQARLYYWKDHNGPEVDYVIEYNRQYLPIEVKYTSKPLSKDADHLHTFQQEYDCLSPALIVCRIERPMEIANNIIAIPWSTLPMMIKKRVEA